MPEGKLLVICRAGCSVQEILEATGLTWSALFEEQETRYFDSAKKAFPAAEVLQALADESMIVAVAACNIGQGVELSVDDKQRLLLAYERIAAARSMSLGR